MDRLSTLFSPEIRNLATRLNIANSQRIGALLDGDHERAAFWSLHTDNARTRLRMALMREEDWGRM